MPDVPQTTPAIRHLAADQASAMVAKLSALGDNFRDYSLLRAGRVKADDDGTDAEGARLLDAAAEALRELDVALRTGGAQVVDDQDTAP